MKKENRVSAGGFVFKRDVQPESWLIVKQKEGHKGPPKGFIEAGEKPEDAAHREIIEETGVKAAIVHPNPFMEDYNYIYKETETLVHKSIYFYLMEYLESDPDHQQDKEIAEIMWLTRDQVLNQLTFDTTRAVFRNVLEIFDEKFLDRDFHHNDALVG